MDATLSTTHNVASAQAARAFMQEVWAGLRAGELAPYLGPGLLTRGASLPCSEPALAEFLGKKVALPRRARGNMWAAAQYIESQRHRATLVRYLEEAFTAGSAASRIHTALARLPLPLIVDVWYDGSMRSALAQRGDWSEIQGCSRAGIGEQRWYRAYGASGSGEALDAAAASRTLLYKPLGSAIPARNFIISDADHVEVLTEIDIQSPIPECVKQRRAHLGFVFLGCRFNEQTLRSYARQIVKRSKGPNYCVLDPTAAITRNESKFLAELNARVLVFPYDGLAELTDA